MLAEQWNNPISEGYSVIELFVHVFVQQGIMNTCMKNFLEAKKRKMTHFWQVCFFIFYNMGRIIRSPAHVDFCILLEKAVLSLTSKRLGQVFEVVQVQI